MIKINCYKTNSEFLPKSFCKLAEKSFYSFDRTIVITSDKELSNILDRVLWTYSKKHFIPHGKIDDPLPEIQPVLISDDLENFDSSAQNIILVNLSQGQLQKSILSLCSDNILSKISIIFDDTAKISNNYISDIFKKSNLQIENINFFQQLSLDKWKNIT